MNNVKSKVVKRRRWKINNINYIERLLDITETKNIFWSLEEKEKLKGELIINKERKGQDYNIKNLIEQLPTYKIMTRRNNEIYDEKCPRCNKEEETWIHIWQCDANEIKIEDIIIEEIDNQIMELHQSNISINREIWHNRIMEILIKRSNYIKGGYIFHEIIKGIFNNQIYEMELQN
ncbi:hypothetical protein C1645_817915 [Glomus cerebriforme]|uniref:Uncharacterized protein n=1 Tax=Glomus cerebriforme TaxID=658196 RepID=A0A397TI74_9GLOM|nr:hypothetical protein C1645_817915 [Glomus cerebriforme]